MQKGLKAEGRAQYIDVQNAAYAFGRAASAAAKVLFAGVPATRRLFRLGEPPAPAPEQHTRTAPARGHKAVPFETPLLPDTRLRLRLPTPKKGHTATLYRVLAPDAPLVEGLTLSADQRRLDVPAAALGSAGQWLVVASGGAYPVRVALAVRG